MLRFEVYKDKAGEWRWRAKVGPRIVADSAEGYATKWNAKRALRRLVRHAKEAS